MPYIKWLLAIVLLQGVLLFSGAVLCARPKEELSGTEAVYISKRHAVKSISYQRALRKAYQVQNRLIFFDKPLTELSRFASIHTKTLNKIYNSKKISESHNLLFYHSKISSQENEDPDSDLI